MQNSCIDHREKYFQKKINETFNIQGKYHYASNQGRACFVFFLRHLSKIFITGIISDFGTSETNQISAYGNVGNGNSHFLSSEQVKSSIIVIRKIFSMYIYIQQERFHLVVIFLEHDVRPEGHIDILVARHGSELLVRQ